MRAAQAEKNFVPNPITHYFDFSSLEGQPPPKFTKQTQRSETKAPFNANCDRFQNIKVIAPGKLCFLIMTRPLAVLPRIAL